MLVRAWQEDMKCVCVPGEKAMLWERQEWLLQTGQQERGGDQAAPLAWSWGRSSGSFP